MWDTKPIIAYLLQIYEFLEKYLIFFRNRLKYILALGVKEC